jgi:hypothetical protein
MPGEIVQLCQATLECLIAAEGDSPTFQAIDSAVRSRGVGRPEEALLEARELGYVTFRGELAWPTQISLMVAGHFLAKPNDPLLHRYFVPVIRSLVDRLDRETLLSPTEARPVIVFASEMEQLRAATPVDVKIVGRLLDVEEVGRIEWTEDPTCPWSSEIDFKIRELANIASIRDFLEVVRWKRI